MMCTYLQALLNHVGGELVLGKVQQVALHLSDEHSAVCLPPMLHHELYHIVAVAVLHQLWVCICVCVYICVCVSESGFNTCYSIQKEGLIGVYMYICIYVCD
jgi:hypothetical protein